MSVVDDKLMDDALTIVFTGIQTVDNEDHARRIRGIAVRHAAAVRSGAEGAGNRRPAARGARAGGGGGGSLDWAELYSHLIACTGWTWEYIDDHMTIPRLSAMTRYWNQNPPVHVLVAGYIGYEAPEDGRGRETACGSQAKTTSRR
jgi:hypothetical protein